MDDSPYTSSVTGLHNSLWLDNATRNATNTTMDIVPSRHFFYFDLERLQLLHAIVGICAIVVCFVGLVSNGLSLAILLQRDMKSTTYTFLTALSCSDILVLISGTLIICLVSVEEWGSGLVDSTFLPYFYRLLHPIGLICIQTSVYLTVALSADRYIAVCHGMNRANLCSITRAWKVIVAIFVFCTIYNIPTFFEFEIQYNYVHALEHKVALFKVSDLGESAPFRYLYRSWLAVPLMWGIPFMALTYMNIRLMLAVNQSRQTAKRLRQPILSQGNDVTLMLITMILVFLVCQSPFHICTLMWALQPKTTDTTYFTEFNFVATLLVILNSSLNFFICTLLGRKFRKKFIKTFCARCCKTSTTIVTTESSESPIMRGNGSSRHSSPFIHTRNASSCKSDNGNGTVMAGIANTSTPCPLTVDHSLVPMEEAMSLQSACSSLEIDKSLQPLPVYKFDQQTPRTGSKRIRWPSFRRIKDYKNNGNANALQDTNVEVIALETRITSL